MRPNILFLKPTLYYSSQYDFYVEVILRCQSKYIVL